MAARFTGTIKRLGPSVIERSHRRRRFAVVLVAILVATILFADGYLTCWYLAKRNAALQPKEETGCVIPQSLVSRQLVSDTSASPFVGKAGSYSHDVLGLSFSYPIEWGPVAIQEEYGQTSSGQNIIIGLLLSFNLNGRTVVFMHASNPNTEPVTRMEDGWGAESVNVSSLHDVQTWCDGRDDCEVFMNPQGLFVARVESAQGVGEQVKPFIVYYLFNPQGGYNGVALSSRWLADAGINDETLERDFAALIESVSLTRQ